MSERQRCDMCDKPVGPESLDLWAQGVTFDSEGEVLKTGLSPRDEHIVDDYIVIGPCCMVRVAGLWNEMVGKIRSR